MINSVRTINNANQLRERIKKFVIEVIYITNGFPKNSAGFKVGGQLVASAGSVGVNFCEAQAARSKKEFISIIGISLREAHETSFWLEIVEATNLTEEIDKLKRLIRECGELRNIIAKTLITAKKN